MRLVQRPAGPQALAPYERLRDSLRPWVELGDEQWRTLSGVFRPQLLDAQQHQLLPGAAEHQLVYVVEGLLRFYWLGPDGLESNKAFVTRGAFAGPLAAASLRLPVVYGVQALERTTLLVADFAKFTALYDEHPVFDRLGRRLAESLLVRKELRTRSMLQLGARDRYLSFLGEHPDLVGRVPQYHVASYLGITEVTLSRLKRELGGSGGPGLEGRRG